MAADYEAAVRDVLGKDFQVAAEHPFCSRRKWRFDFALPDQKVAIEIDGGAWVAGRHNRPVGFERDIEKLNAAAFHGWTVFRATPKGLNRVLAEVRAYLLDTGLYCRGAKGAACRSGPQTRKRPKIRF